MPSNPPVCLFLNDLLYTMYYDLHVLSETIKYLIV